MRRLSLASAVPAPTAPAPSVALRVTIELRGPATLERPPILPLTLEYTLSKGLVR